MLFFCLLSSSTCRCAAVRTRLGLSPGVAEQLVRMGLGLADDAVGVLLGVGHCLLRVLVGVAPGLLGLEARLARVFFGDRGALLGLGHHLLGGFLGVGEPLGLLPLGFLAARGKVHLELRLGLRPRGLAVLEGAPGLAAHFVGLPRGRREHVVPVALG